MKIKDDEYFEKIASLRFVFNKILENIEVESTELIQLLKSIEELFNKLERKAK
jgi:hypothetical protein